MGRRARATKSEEKVLLPENANPSLERVEQPEIHANASNLSPRRIVKKHTAASRVRRSERIQNVLVSAKTRDIERVINEVTFSESEKEDEQHTCEDGEPPEENLHYKSLEEKADYLLQKLEEQQKIIEELKSTAIYNSLPSESPNVAEAKYRSLYFDSQKRVEALIDENHRLALKLENALGKLEAYENGANAFSGVMDKLKDVILVSHLTRAAENAVNVSSQAIHDAIASIDTALPGRTSPSKRKRLGKESKMN